MARPEPDEEIIPVVMKLPKSVWKELLAEGATVKSSETGLPYKSVPLFCRKIILDWLKQKSESKKPKKK